MFKRKKGNWLWNLGTRPVTALWALIVGVAIGVAPLVYQEWVTAPRLAGRVITIVTGQVSQSRDTKPLHTTFTTFLFVANRRDTPIPVVDYEMDAQLDGEWVELRPMHVDEEVLPLQFIDGGEMRVPYREIGLFYKTSELVTPNHPLFGVIVFTGPPNLWERKLTSVRLRMIDGLGGTHEIENDQSDFRSERLLEYLVPSMARPQVYR